MSGDRVVAGFFSFTEVEAGEHRSYNEWHLLDHQPEQYTLPGVVWGQRWVLPPALRGFAAATDPLDRTHYFTLYLLAEPLDRTLREFQALGVRLARAGRFHRHRTAHLAGAAAVTGRHASPRVGISADAVPFRPGTGLHVRVAPTGGGAVPTGALLDLPGVAGVWTFAADDRTRGDLDGLRVVVAWLDGEVAVTAAAIADVAPSPPCDAASCFTATLTTVDPHGPWDWFDR